VRRKAADVVLWVLILAVGAAVWVFLHPAKAAPLAIVTAQGDELMRCKLPTQYLPDMRALVCDQPPLFADGFE
jgi:hypothetical protein